MNELQKQIVIVALSLCLVLGALVSAAGLLRSDAAGAYENLPLLACQHQGGASGGGC